MRSERKTADQRQQPPLPRAIEYRLALGHRVDERPRRKERDDESRVEPRPGGGGDDVRGLREGLETGDRDTKEMCDDPSRQGSSPSVEAWWVGGFGADQRIERRPDQRPVLGTAIARLLWRVSGRGSRGGRG